MASSSSSLPYASSQNFNMASSSSLPYASSQNFDMASSFSSSAFSSVNNSNRCTYDVFLNFRGKDTRTNFVSHLYQALCGKGVNTFIDDKLQRGEVISPALLAAIEGSRIALLVFSQDYASSTYCLDELVKILDCRRSIGQLVLPIFYKVDPSQVEELTGTFHKAFARHKAQFKNMEKVQIWRVALAEAANLSGWHLDDGDEAKFIQVIVEKVLLKLNCTLMHVADYPVGLDSHLRNLILKLSLGSDDVRMIGICGIGGIGKTTIAKALYNSIANHFEASCFLANVREISKQHGVAYLQEALLFEILGDRRSLVGNFDSGINVIMNRLCKKTVLIVIDDVDDVDQLKKLAGELDWFGYGSRIVITTRDEHLLVNHRVDNVYKVTELCTDDALHLFSWHAFKKQMPLDDYVELSHSILTYAKGLPLALVVLGSFLYGRSVCQWTSELDKLKRIPNKRICDVLKISFDGLDDHEKSIFLDVACFFKGLDKCYAMEILAACGFNPEIGIQVLVEKSLITLEFGTLQMHDLIQLMGRQVVHQESPNAPGKQSRLWFHEDILHVLRENMGTPKIEGILLHLPEPDEIWLNADAFTNMKMLRILIIRNALIVEVPENLPNELRWLEWPRCPFESLPSTFHPRKLVTLNMPNSRIREFGLNFKNYMFLKNMDLRGCESLRETPDFSTIPNIVRLNLSGCRSLVEIHQSLGFLDKLVFLKLSLCTNLKTLPSFFRLRSLQTLVLTGCTKLEELPVFMKEMARLEAVYLQWTAIKELPPSIEYLTGLKVLALSFCKNLTCVPSGICKLQHLNLLDLDGCSLINELPVYLWNNMGPEPDSSMVYSNNVTSSSTSSLLPQLLSPTAPEFNSSLSGHLSPCFPHLTQLVLRNCNLSDLHFLLTPNFFSMVTGLDLSGNMFSSIPSCIRKFTNLTSLILSKCEWLQEIPELPPKIMNLVARDCKSLRRCSQMKSIHEFGLRGKYDFSNCHKFSRYSEGFSSQSLKWEKVPSMVIVSIFCQAFGLVLPGSKILKWFSYQKEGDSLCLEVPPHMLGKIKAFVVSFVFSLQDVQRLPVVDVYINDMRTHSSCSNFDLFGLESDHTCIMNKLIPRGVLETSSYFNFSFRINGLLVKRCGVHPICQLEDGAIEDNLE